MTQATEWKSNLICFISFNCEKTHKVWLKKSLKLTLWLRFNDIWPFGPSPGPQGVGTKKNCAVACAIDVSYPHTKSGWISEYFFFTTQPPTVPSSPTQAREWKSHLICFISFICEKTHKVWFKNLWNWLCNWNLMIFNNIWPFGPSPGPQGAGPKKMCRCTPFPCEQLTHQIWLNFVQQFRRR